MSPRTTTSGLGEPRPSGSSAAPRTTTPGISSSGRFRGVALVAAAGIALTGCSDQEPTTEENQGTASTSGELENSAPSPTREPSEAEATGGSSIDPSEDPSAGASDANASGEDISIPNTFGASDPPEAPSDLGDPIEEPDSDEGSQESDGPVDGGADIAGMADVLGIDDRTDGELSAVDTCGHWQGAVSDPAAIDDPDQSVTAMLDLAAVAPERLKDPLTQLAAGFEDFAADQDRGVLGDHLMAVEEACLEVMS